MEQSDEELARMLQEKEYMDTGGASTPMNNANNSIIIPNDGELLDFDTEAPFKDIHQLFLAFNDLYFESMLSACEVRWSPKMTRCAGLCYYQPKANYCSIRLSEPLLKFRSESDYIDTLLHEMIHAYLFVTQAIQDHDGHGDDFQRHMNRINKAAGTTISIYHTFHDEVDHYQTHIWKCNGPCQTRPPYYGIVKRSMNRPPQPADKWYAKHQKDCGGTYTKISEPESTKRKSSSSSSPSSPSISSKLQNNNQEKSTSKARTWMDSYFSVSKSSEPTTSTTQSESKSKDNSKDGKSSKVEDDGHRWPQDTTKSAKTLIEINSDEEIERLPPRVAAAAAAIERQQRLNNPTIKSKSRPPTIKRKVSDLTKLTENGEEKAKRTKAENIEPVDISHSDTGNIAETGGKASTKVADSKRKTPRSNGDVVAVRCPVCFQEKEEATINEHVDLCLWETSSIN